MKFKVRRTKGEEEEYLWMIWTLDKDSEDKEGELYIFKILEPLKLDGPKRCYIVISVIPK